jgi:germination protein M
MLVSGGCSIGKTAEDNSGIDAPPAGTYSDADLGAINPKDATSGAQDAAKLMEVTLYVRDPNGFVAPLSVRLPYSPDVAKKTLEYMVDGGPGQAFLPKGFSNLLPKGTIVKGIRLQPDQKLAVVDFSKEFADYNVQDERKIMEAVTWALTGFPNVEKVQLWLEGSALKEMPVDGTPMDEPLSRAMGINLERADGVDYGRSTPVTLYFQNQTGDNFKYYIPVTRLIGRTGDIEKAVVQELIKGPQGVKGLASVINPETKMLGVTQQNDLVTVNFTDTLLGADHTAPAESLQAVVLSLTENTGADKVQIMVNGETTVVANDKSSFSKPVDRPVHVNEVKM